MRPNGSMPPGRISVFKRFLRVNLARSPAPVPFSAASVSVTYSPNTEAETIINLRDFYPYYTTDSFIEVPDEVAEAMAAFDRMEAAYRLRAYRHKAYYSLDREDGIEHSALFVSLSPCEIYERKITMQELHAAISSLPDKQAKRIYAHFVLGMSKTDIAKAEGVAKSRISESIQRGLRSMEKYLKNSF